MQVNGQTTVLAVWGDPISHSLSPAMHNAAFTTLGMNCIYIPFHVKPDSLADAVDGIRALNIKGVNLTIPHKQAVAPHIDEVFGEALQSGSVNTIINRGGKLYGTSTDGIGLVRSLKEDGGFELTGKKVFVLGAGGAATAVIYSLIHAGIQNLTLANRDTTKAVVLQQRVRHTLGFEIEVMDFTQLNLIDFDNYDLLINTTPVGLVNEETIVPKRLLKPNLFVYDMVYKRGGTMLIHDAATQGCQYLTGLSMLLYQGAESFKLWFEVEPPFEVMRKAIS